MPKSKKSKKLSFAKTRFNRTGLFATILIFGAIGAYMLVRSFAATGRITVNAPVVAIAQAGANNKYWVATSDGGVFALPQGSGQSAAPFYGSMGGKKLAQPITSMAARPQGDGYWLLGGDGGVFAFGGAKYFGGQSTTTSKFYRAIVPTPTGNGYYIIGALGQMTPYGDAVTSYWNIITSGYKSILTDYKKYNSEPLSALPGLALNSNDIVAAATTGHGMFLVSTNGSVYAYGDAVNRGGAAATASGIVARGAGSSGGYTITTTKGAIYAYNMGNYGHITTTLAGPIKGIASTPGAKGYWLAGQDGGIFAYGDAVFQQALQAPVPAPTPAPAPKPAATPAAAPAPTSSTTAGGTSSGSTARSVVPSAAGTGSSASACSGDLKVDIKQLQRCINSLGAQPPLAVDGDPGPLTRQACTSKLGGYCPYPIIPPPSGGGSGTTTSKPLTAAQKKDLANSFGAGSFGINTYTADSSYSHSIINENGGSFSEGSHSFCWIGKAGARVTTFLHYEVKQWGISYKRDLQIGNNVSSPSQAGACYTFFWKSSYYNFSYSVYDESRDQKTIYGVSYY